MLQAIEGTYTNGQIELTEKPRNITRAKIIVTFVEIQDEQPNNQNVSFAEAAKHLIGSVSSGLSDLSTNPKYMEDFGK